jgi:putative heme degradation protein
MEVTKSGADEVTISGEIKGVTDYLKVKRVVSELLESGTDSFILKIPDSANITSALIGYLLRLATEDKIGITVYVGNSKLMNLFEVMNLVQVFNVKTYQEV